MNMKRSAKIIMLSTMVGLIIVGVSKIQMTTMSFDIVVVLITIAAGSIVAVHDNKEHNNSITDKLTSVSNRRGFDNALKVEFERQQRSSNPQSMSLIMFDIDYFKQFNDKYGHLAGDDCIRSVFQAVKDSLQRPADCVGRYGGDEGIIMLPDTDFTGVVHIAESIRKSVLELTIEHVDSQCHEYVTLSIGCVSTIPGRNMTLTNVLTSLDKALYESKEEGRNRIHAKMI